MVTIRDLLRDQCAERQLAVLIRADQLFAHLFQDGQGRFYGGILTDEQIDQLDSEYHTRQASNQT